MVRKVTIPLSLNPDSPSISFLTRLSWPKIGTLLVLLSLLLPLAGQQTWDETLSEALLRQQESCPEEKIYLHTDRPMYRPGETIWLAGYLLGHDQQFSSATSDVLRVDLLNPAGSVVHKIVLARDVNVFRGDFMIGPDWAGGIYRLRAYTNYLGNFGDEWIFEKEITVQKSVEPDLLLTLDFEREAYGPGAVLRAFLEARDGQDQYLVNETVQASLRIDGHEAAAAVFETNAQGTATIEMPLPEDLASSDVILSARLDAGGRKGQISRRPSVVLEDVKLQFFPEGGDWVASLPTRMAFKATDAFGEPADVAGVITNAYGDEVLRFESLHDGMGSIQVPAGVQWPLTARLEQPIKGNRRYPIPNPIMGQWQVTVNYDGGEELELEVHSLVSDAIFLAVRAAGQLKTHELQLYPGEQRFRLNIADLPLGTAQITAFDQALRPNWERIVFLHPDRQARLSVTPREDQFTPYGLIDLELELTDDKNQPLPGQVSISVVDDRLHTFADDKQPHIKSQLLLNSELRGEIHEPNFYFDPEEELAGEALDLLMMTHGWRRFHWLQMLQYDQTDWTAAVTHAPEALQVKGRVLVNGHPLAGASVSGIGQSMEVRTDDDGFFAMPPSLNSQHAVVEVKHRGLRAQQTLWGSRPNIQSAPYQPGQQQMMDNRTLTEFWNDEQNEEMVAMKDELAEMPQASAPVPIVEQQNAITSDIQIHGARQLDEVVVTGYSMRLVDQSMHHAAATIVEYDDMQGLSLDLDLDDEVPQVQIYNPDYYARSQFYQARQFMSPNYSRFRDVNTVPQDQRTTLYWNPKLQLGSNGKTRLTFYASGETTTYRLIAEGFAQADQIVRAEATFSVAPPVSIQATVPPFAAVGDTLRLPVIVQNTTDEDQQATLTMSDLPTGLTLLSSNVPEQLSLSAGQLETYTVECLVKEEVRGEAMAWTAQGKGWRSRDDHSINLVNKGFPSQASISGDDAEARYQLNIHDPIPNSISAELQIFADLSGELLAGVESMLQEPNGCFEQTSSTNYPNIMVLRYLQEKGQMDESIRRRAVGLLERGYKRLAGFEVPTGGFSLFGRGVGDPILTAFGLIQFYDLQEVWPNVDSEMLERTEEWLAGQLAQRSFTGTIDDGYLLWALYRGGKGQYPEYLQTLTVAAEQEGDPYLLALAGHLNYHYGSKNKAAVLAERLLELFGEDQFAGRHKSPSLSHSQGQSVPVELTGWAVLNGLDQNRQLDQVIEMVDYLTSRRNYGGRFGATPATVMALKALTAFERYQARPKGDGTLVLQINGTLVDTIRYHQDAPARLHLTDLGQYFREGRNSIHLSYLDTPHPLPYTLDVDWQTFVPYSHEQAPLELQASLAQSEIRLSESVRYSVSVRNTRGEEAYAPMVLVGLPAGLSWQPWQLKELMDQERFDYYELRDHYLILYFTELAAGEVRTLNFDLIGTVPGTYQAPAATAYQYYFDEAKTWVQGPSIHIQ